MYSRLLSCSSVARSVGTTFTVEDLFSNLPVRRAEFLRGLKSQYHRLLQVLQAYALVSTDVRFSVTNISKKGARSAVLSTQRSSRLSDNIAAVFGSQVGCLLSVCCAGWVLWVWLVCCLLVCAPMMPPPRGVCVCSS
jgi:DNA mismatch repair ATPase MutL